MCLQTYLICVFLPSGSLCVDDGQLIMSRLNYAMDIMDDLNTQMPNTGDSLLCLLLARESWLIIISLDGLGFKPYPYPQF